MSNPVQQNGGPPPWVTAEGNIPPNVIASHDGAQPTSLLSGTAEPPTSLLVQLSSALATGFPDSPLSSSLPSHPNGPPAGFSIPAGATGPPPGLILPSGVTGPPPGFTPPPGLTGPPAGFSIPAGMTGPPPGFSIPSGVTGFPAGATGIPASLFGNGPSVVPPQFRNHAMTRQQSQTLIGVTCMLLILCVAAVSARFMARRVSRMRLESDDWSTVASLAILIGLCIEQFVLANYGFQMLSDLPPSMKTLHGFGKTEFASQMTYSFAVSATKVSLLLLYRRIFSLRLKWFRIAWWVNMGLVAAMLVVMIALDCNQCSPLPLSTIWNSPGACLPSQTESSSVGFINALIDSAILVLPLRMVWSLQMSHKQKVAICGVFGLGLIAVAVSIARAITLSSPHLFSHGALGLILWSTTEPAVALICSCLPVMRPLYTIGLKKLNASRGWSWYNSKRSKTSDYATGSSGRDKENSNLSGSTVRSPITTKTKSEKLWSNTAESEISGPYQEMHSPVLPLNKPLPPAYSPRKEEDTGYHTWSWNLLSRPRNEGKAPKLTRSPTVRDSAAPWRSPTSPHTGVQTTVSGGKWSNKVNPIRLKPQPPTPNKSFNPRGQFENWSSPSWKAKTSISQTRSPTQNPTRYPPNSSTPTPPAPMRHVAKCDLRHQSLAGSPEGGFLLPPKPRPTARIETEEFAAPPKLTVRTANNNRAPPPSPMSPPKVSTSTANKGWDREPGGSNGGEGRALGLPEERPVSNVTIWPTVGTDVTRGDVEAAAFRGQAL